MRFDDTNEKYNRSNFEGTQETLGGISDLKGMTMSSQSEYQPQLGGTLSSLLNSLNSSLTNIDYNKERRRMAAYDPLVNYQQSLYSTGPGNQTAHFKNEAEFKSKILQNYNTKRSHHSDESDESEIPDDHKAEENNNRASTIKHFQKGPFRTNLENIGKT